MKPARKLSRRRRSGGRMPPKDVEETFRRFQQAMPEPKTELRYSSPFTLLVAVVLSAQATDAGVNKATPALFAKADTPEKMIKLGEAKVTELIRTIGLFRTKARNVVALSRMLVAEYGGKVPATREELEKLPGVGRKTANVVMNVAFGASTLAVDTFSASPIVRAWRRAPTCARSRMGWSASCRNNTLAALTTG